MSTKEGIRSLPKQVWQLGWISFFADVCSEMAYPILSLFIVALGQGPAALGLVEGVAEAIVSFMKGASGVRTDVTGKRVPYVQAGYGLSALGKPVIALAGGWPLVLAGRSLDRFGKGIRTTARDTLIVDAAGEKRLGAAFGLQRALDTAGAFTGVLITLLMLHLFRGRDEISTYRTILLISFIPGVVAVIFTLLLKDKKADLPEGEVKERPKFDLKSMPAGYWRAVVVTTVFAVANSSDQFLILRAREIFGQHYGATQAIMFAIWAYALYNVVYTFVSYPAGELSDRIGRWKVLAGGWAIYAAIYAGFAVVRSPALVWILFALYGIYIGSTDGVSKALVGDFAPKGAKGTAMGLFYMITGFATLAASGLAGLLWSFYGPKAAFGFGSAMAVVAVILAISLVGTTQATKSA